MLVDAAVLVSIFVWYAVRLAGAPAEEPDLIGTSKWVGELGSGPRRTVCIAMFAVATLVILAYAEHFAESLVDTRSQLGIDQFVLVQWVAPVASEAPELIVACLYAARLHAADSLGTLLSSKVNQWTLLVGTIPVVFALSSGSLSGLLLDDQQRSELLLTAAQSLFAVSILITLALSTRAAVQFLASLLLPAEIDRMVVLGLSGPYLVLALVQFVRHRRELLRTTRDGLRTPFAELVDDRVAAAS